MEQDKIVNRSTPVINRDLAVSDRVVKIKCGASLRIVFECVGDYTFTVFAVKRPVIILMNVNSGTTDVIFYENGLAVFVDRDIP